MIDDDQDDPVDQEERRRDAEPLAVNPKKQRRRKVDAKLADRDAAAFWREVFASPIGRAEMWKLLQAADTFEAPFAASPAGFPDPFAAFHRAGAHAFGQRLYRTWLARDPLAVAQMHAEHDAEFQRFQPS